MVYITPSTPPTAQIRKVVQNGKPVQAPIITRPGSTKTTEAMAPAAEATVWTMLFSTMVEFLKARRRAMEITAAGIEVAKVSATFRPRNTLAAVKTKVISTPRITPRQLSSTRGRAAAA
jgi:hypothetical protein